MSSHIILNGKRVSTSTQDPDASGSNYILLQTKGEPLNKAQKTKLKDLGAEIQEFVGNEDNQLYLCGYKPESLDEIRQLDFIGYANVYLKDFVVPSTIQQTARQTSDTGDTQTIKVDVLLHHDVEEASQELIDKIASAAHVESSDISVGQGLIRLEVDPQNLDSISAIDEVRVIHPVNARKLFNNVARKILNADKAVVNNTTYRGEGQLVAVADTGFDKGSTTDVHDAFTGRVHKIFAWGRTDNADDPDGHGTHVCGSVLGSGTADSEGRIEGTAPAAKLIMQSTLSKHTEDGGTELGGIPEDFGKLFEQAYQLNARVHTNSWGTPLPASGKQQPYDAGAEHIDRFVWNNQDMTILFAAGNDGQDRDSKGKLDGKVNERSLGAEAGAKSCITVGATENLRPNLKSAIEGLPYTYGGFWSNEYTANPLKDDNMANNPDGLAAFSSRGQTAENRFKPDIVAPGTAILSTRSRNATGSEDGVFGVMSDKRYLYLAGTSMATPLVAGCCAVVRETLVKNGYKDEENGVKKPTGALVKALLINGALPIKGQYVPKEVGEEPNGHSGFGRVDLASSIAVPNSAFSGYGAGVMDDDQKPITISVAVPKQTGLTNQQPNGRAANGSLTLQVTLAYADPPGAALFNDLNLVVVAGNKERHGNQSNNEFSVGSSQSFDRRNNVERVVWPKVPGEKIQIIIKAYRMTSEKAPFAYAWRFF